MDAIYQQYDASQQQESYLEIRRARLASSIPFASNDLAAELLRQFAETETELRAVREQRRGLLRQLARGARHGEAA